MKKLFGIVAALAVLTNAPLQANAAVTIINGDFQTSPPVVAVGGFTTLTGAALPGWNVTLGSIDLLNMYDPSGPNGPYPGAQGTTQYIDLAGNAPGAISQTLSGFTPGQQYTVEFFYSRNPDRVTNPTGTTTLGASIGNFSYLGVITPTSLNWQKGSISFIAGNDPTYNLTFAAASNAGAYGAFLDQVSITATPEPTTIVVWSGLAAIGGFVAYRRRMAA